MLSTRLSRWFVFGLLAICIGLSAHFSGAQKRPGLSGLTVHEWGTFTSIAGSAGQAVQWLPLSGPNDLPSFVEHFRNAAFKLGLCGTVRMETPVLYFYAPRKMSLSVHVSFSKGVLTEWYPHADRVAPTSLLADTSLLQKNTQDGAISWDSVTVDPDATPNFPREDQSSRYYAARDTSATPLTIHAPAGDEQEKFLFYRGVASFSVPMAARVAEGKIAVTNLGEQRVPATILFERRGDKLGYRIGGAVDQQVVLDSPSLTNSIDSLEATVEKMLVSQGLYADEAHAMVETWHDSWFEEGSRLMYVVPAKFLDSILPLSIQPAPSQTVRVFVGRLELITPATENAVETAIESHDANTLRKYGRFLEPILAQLTQKLDPAQASDLRASYMATLKVPIPN